MHRDFANRRPTHVNALSPADEPPVHSSEHPVESAARHMLRRVPIGRPDNTVGAILGELATADFASVHAVYVVDAEDRLIGVVPIATLLGAGMQHHLEEIMHEPQVTVSPEDDQELVAAAAIENEISEVPVTDAGGRLLGIVPAQALLRIQLREHIEDIERLAGILRSDRQARAAMEGSRWSHAVSRLPWLVIGLVGGGLATWVMSAFEAQLADRIAVAFFIPAMVYLAGAIGTQSVSIAVRGLSVSRVGLRALIASELVTGLIIGFVLAALAFPAIAWFMDDIPLAAAVCLALIVAATLSTTIGLLLPWAIWKSGGDPALGSGPLATILQDILTLLAYFATVAWLL